MNDSATKQLYIVISQTGTILSRILKFVTGAEYNHASISLSEDLSTMYSFGRKYPHNPFWGGLVLESPHTGTFRRFSETRALVLVVNISKNQHTELSCLLDRMWKGRKRYHYNYIGLSIAVFHKAWKKENCFYCSEFVADILLRIGVEGSDRLPTKVIQPIHFLSLPHKQIYCGRLSDYPCMRKFGIGKET